MKNIIKNYITTTLAWSVPKLLWLGYVMPDKNRPVNAKGDTALHFAVRQRSPEGVKILLKMGISPMVTNKEGFNALALATKIYSDDITIKKRVDEADCSHHSYSTLVSAIHYSKEVLALLTQHQKEQGVFPRSPYNYTLQ